MQVPWKYMRRNETTSDPQIASCVPRPFTMQIEVNRFKTDSTWFKQISGNKIINKSLQSRVQKAPELGGRYGSQSHPFVPERGWPNGMTFSSQSQFHILSQLCYWPPSKKKHVQDCYIVAGHLPCRLLFKLFSVFFLLFGIEPLASDPSTTYLVHVFFTGIFRMPLSIQKSIHGPYLRMTWFLFVSGPLWVRAPGIGQVHSLNSSPPLWGRICANHVLPLSLRTRRPVVAIRVRLRASFALYLAAGQAKERNKFNKTYVNSVFVSALKQLAQLFSWKCGRPLVFQYHQRQNKACSVSEWQPGKGNRKMSSHSLPIFTHLMACAQTLRHMKSKQHSELELVLLQDREVTLRVASNGIAVEVSNQIPWCIWFCHIGPLTLRLCEQNEHLADLALHCIAMQPHLVRPASWPHRTASHAKWSCLRHTDDAAALKQVDSSSFREWFHFVTEM